MRFKSNLVHASKEEPQYLLKSDKTDHFAMHKGTAHSKDSPGSIVYRTIGQRGGSRSNGRSPPRAAKIVPDIIFLQMQLFSLLQVRAYFSLRCFNGECHPYHHALPACFHLGL